MRELIDTTMELERDGKTIDVQVEGYVIYSEDRQYGSDADGNRGEKRISVDDVVDVMATDDGEDVDLTKTELEQAQEMLGDKFLEG